MYIKSSICGIQHTCINYQFLIFSYNSKNRVLACFQTRAEPKGVHEMGKWKAKTTANS